MADLVYDGFLRVAWVPTVASIAAPTVANLTGGTDLTPRLAPDGMSISADTGTVDTTKMADTTTSQMVGRGTFTLSVTYMLADSADTAGELVRTTLVYKASGFLVVRRNVAYTTAWTAAQKAEVYPVQCGYGSPSDPGPDSVQTVTVPLTLTGTPRDIANPATVAA